MTDELSSIIKRWLSVEELATYLGISPKSLYNRTGPKSKNPLPSTVKPKRIGKLVKFDRLAIDRHLEQNDTL